MKKIVSVLFILTLLISVPLWAGSAALGTGCCAIHTLATTDNGIVYAWGSNTSGQLGDNAEDYRSTVPVAVDTTGVLSGKTITAVSMGGDHSVALSSDGIVYTWGRNNEGQLGNSSTSESSVPVAVDMSGVLSGKTITAITAGSRFSGVLASDGTVYTWGDNAFGQLGNNSTASSSSVPVAVDKSGVLSGKTITSIAAGREFVLVLASDGSLYAWGNGASGQLGDSLSTNSSVPVAVDLSGLWDGETITAIAAGYYHSVALSSNAMVYAWGSNYSGQVGSIPETKVVIPWGAVSSESNVLSGNTVTAIAASAQHTLILASDGTLYTWGANNFGQLGDNTTTNSSWPVAVDKSGVLSGKTVTAIATGNNYSIAMASDGTVYTWGWNCSGQLGNKTRIDSSVPVKVVNSNNSDFFVPVKDVAQEFALEANYPNPFNPTTAINYQLSSDSDVELSIFDMNGRKITTLVNEAKSTGSYSVTWDASNVSSGIYLYRLTAGNFVETQKMVFMK